MPAVPRNNKDCGRRKMRHRFLANEQRLLTGLRVRKPSHFRDVDDICSCGSLMTLYKDPPVSRDTGNDEGQKAIPYPLEPFLQRNLIPKLSVAQDASRQATCVLHFVLYGTLN